MRPAATARAATRTAAVPIQPGTSADGAVQRLAGALLLLAARRYPEPVRSELALEWTSELHAIVHDDDHSRLYRAYWALRYSGSLAVTAVLFSRSCQAGATTSGSTRLKNGLIAAAIVVIAITAAVAFIRAGAAAARANAYAAAASAAYNRAYADAAAARAVAAAARADTPSPIPLLLYIRARAAAARADARAVAAAARANDAAACADARADAALVTLAVLVAALRLVTVKLRRARRKVRSR